MNTVELSYTIKYQNQGHIDQDAVHSAIINNKQMYKELKGMKKEQVVELASSVEYECVLCGSTHVSAMNGICDECVHLDEQDNGKGLPF